VRNSLTVFERREALVVEVVGEGGLSGWGECSDFPVAVWSYVESVLAAQLLGQDARMIGRLFRAMLGARAGGDIAMMATSAIDMALWDLRGRAEGVPVSTLLGGRLRDRVRTYASGPFMKPGESPYRDFAADVDGYLSRGFTAIKPRSGLTPRADAEMARELRRRLGPDFAFMIDLNRGYARPAAQESLERLAEAQLLWIEEPIASDDFEGYRMLAGRTGARLAAGEALAKLPQFHDFLGIGAISVLQPDLYLCGGFSGALRILALAEAAGVPYVPHVWGTAVNFHAALQLASVLPAARLGDGAELPLFEWDQTDNAMLRLAAPPEIGAGGTVAIPDGPGIGITIDRDLLQSLCGKAWSIGG
jgi:D-galactarolactone cycloisomerase